MPRPGTSKSTARLVYWTLATLILAFAQTTPARAIDPTAPVQPAIEETAPPRPREVRQPVIPPPSADPCVQARADWAAIERSGDVSVLHSFLQSAPTACAVQRAQAQSRIAALGRSVQPVSNIPPPSTAEVSAARLRASLRAHFAPRFSSAPNIPPTIHAAARRHAGGREVLAVYDLSVALNGNNGLYFLEDGILIKEMFEPARFASYADLRARRRGACTYACVRYGDDVINLPEFNLSDDVGRIIDAAIIASSTP